MKRTFLFLEPTVYRQLERQVHRQVGSNHSEDVFQDLLLHLYQVYDSFSSERGEFSHWAGRVTRNFLCSWRRRPILKVVPASDRFLEASTEPVCHAPRIDESAYARELATRLEAVLPDLPKEYREAFELSLEGDTYREIADKLNCRHGTVMSRISRARDLLSLALTLSP